MKDLVDVVQEAEIKRKFRNVIFIEDRDGNLVKYIRADVQPAEKSKPKRKQKQKLNEKPMPAAASVASVASPPPLKKYEIQAANMTECSVPLLCLSKHEIAEEIAKMKRGYAVNQMEKKLKMLPLFERCQFTRYAISIEPNLQFFDGTINFESVSDDSLRLMNQYMAMDSNGINDITKITASVSKCGGNFSICLPEIGTILISVPMWQNLKLNPLHNPMFTLGDKWSFELHDNGSLAVKLPTMDGKRETFLFSEGVWRSWIGSSVDVSAESFVQSASINSSLMEIDASSLAKLFDDELFNALLSNLSIEQSVSMFENLTLGGYDASIEVDYKINQISLFEIS